AGVGRAPGGLGARAGRRARALLGRAAIPDRRSGPVHRRAPPRRGRARPPRRPRRRRLDPGHRLTTLRSLAAPPPLLTLSCQRTLRRVLRLGPVLGVLLGEVLEHGAVDAVDEDQAPGAGR